MTAIEKLKHEARCGKSRHSERGAAMLQIAQTVCPKMREHVFRLRYDVFVRELGLFSIPTADHSAGTIIEPADESGTLFVATRGDDVIGTVRMNFLRDGPAEPFSSPMGLNDLSSEERDTVSVTSRLLVTKPYRASTVPARIMQECFRYGLSRGARQDYILVLGELIPFYERIGYVTVGEEIELPGAGPMRTLRFDYTNLHRLNAHRYHTQ